MLIKLVPAVVENDGMTEEELDQLLYGPEVWWPIPRFPMYEASNHGRIRSWNKVARGHGYRPPAEPRIMSPNRTGAAGYLKVIICDQNGHHSVYVHHLVLEAFCGPKPEGWQVRHLSGVPGDNRLANLCYGSAQENAADKYRHGTQPLGEEHPQARLTAEQVTEARQRYLQGFSVNSMATALGVSRNTLHRAIVGKTWKHLPGAITPESRHVSGGAA